MQLVSVCFLSVLIQVAISVQLCATSESVGKVMLFAYNCNMNVPILYGELRRQYMFVIFCTFSIRLLDLYNYQVWRE